MGERRLIFGCGYLGNRVAKLWQTGGDEVIVVTRSASRAEVLRAEGFKAIVADVTLPETLKELPSGDSLLFAVGFDRGSGADIHAVYANGLKNVLAALPQSVGRVTYVSTTGVYGSAGGEWVDEATPPNPQREGGKASLAAEEVLRGHPLVGYSAVLRLAGIYGPGRIPYLDKLRAGEPIAAPSVGWLNLIHVDDAAQIVVAANHWLATCERADGSHVFNVSDGAPVVRGDYYAEVARLIGAAPPAFTEPRPNSPAARRAGASRRISNDKMLHTLGVKLTYPSYRDGLAAILNEPADC